MIQRKIPFSLYIPAYTLFVTGIVCVIFFALLFLLSIIFSIMSFYQNSFSYRYVYQSYLFTAHNQMFQDFYSIAIACGILAFIMLLFSIICFICYRGIMNRDFYAYVLSIILLVICLILSIILILIKNYGLGISLAIFYFANIVILIYHNKIFTESQ